MIKRRISKMQKLRIHCTTRLQVKLIQNSNTEPKASMKTLFESGEKIITKPKIYKI